MPKCEPVVPVDEPPLMEADKGLCHLGFWAAGFGFKPLGLMVFGF